jgi:uncharacterized protein YebE (UPF0316 family)
MSDSILSTIAANNIDWYAWVVLPLIIFFARVCDVTLGTIRIIFISRGMRKYAPFLGFFEVLIWIVVIGQLVQHLSSVTAYIGYAAGFATGNFFGMWLEDQLAIGTYILRIMVSEDTNELLTKIHEAGFGVTQVDGYGSMGPVKLVYIVVKRKHVNLAMSIIHKCLPNAFITIEEVRSAEKGIFPVIAPEHHDFHFWQKGK